MLEAEKMKMEFDMVDFFNRQKKKTDKDKLKMKY
jgi:hypothetical protein